MKIISWNVNGIHGILKKDKNGDKHTKFQIDNSLSSMIRDNNPDIVCLQEIRCSSKFDHRSCFSYDKYQYVYCNYSKVRKGYSGTMIATKFKPISVSYDFTLITKDIQLNSEGRVITLEYNDFYLINMYTPNSGTYRLDYRINEWETTTRKYINYLKSKNKGVVLIGDLNCVPHSMDAFKDNLTKFPGATPEEKKAFVTLLNDTDMVDTYRQLHPNTKKFSWFYPCYKSKGYGCRLDFALATKGINVKSSDILDYTGSDHLPIIIEL